jgi:FMN reductase
MSESAARRLAVVTAGLGEPSSSRMLADLLAEATGRALQEHSVNTGIEVVELREHAHDITNNTLTGFPAPALRAAIDTVTGSDALIAVTPIFNASYSGLFKSFFDVLEPGSLIGKPVLLGATGGSPRHSLALEHALRPLFAYLRAVVVPTAVYAASQDWGTAEHDHGGQGAELTGRVDRAGAELAGLLVGKPAERQPDPYEDLTPFEQLLSRK